MSKQVSGPLPGNAYDISVDHLFQILCKRRYTISAEVPEQMHRITKSVPKGGWFDFQLHYSTDVSPLHGFAWCPVALFYNYVTLTGFRVVSDCNNLQMCHPYRVSCGVGLQYSTNMSPLQGFVWCPIAIFYKCVTLTGLIVAGLSATFYLISMFNWCNFKLNKNHMAYLLIIGGPSGIGKALAEASSITGQILHVDGGISDLKV